jgi:hypothetical protein
MYVHSCPKPDTWKCDGGEFFMASEAYWDTKHADNGLSPACEASYLDHRQRLGHLPWRIRVGTPLCPG